MLSIQLVADKKRLACTKFVLYADVLNHSKTTLQLEEKSMRLEDYNFLCIQGSFILFCRHKLDFSKNLADNWECGMKKVTVTGH